MYGLVVPRGQPGAEKASEHPAAEAVGEQQVLSNALQVAGE
jgi:hypothetical protein